MLKIYIQITLEKYLQTRETYNWNNSLRHEPVGPDEFFSYPAIMPRRYFFAHAIFSVKFKPYAKVLLLGNKNY